MKEDALKHDDEFSIWGTSRKLARAVLVLVALGLLAAVIMAVTSLDWGDLAYVINRSG